MKTRLQWLQVLDEDGNPEARVTCGDQFLGYIRMVPVAARGESGRRWMGEGAHGGITALYHDAASALMALAGNRWLVPPAQAYRAEEDAWATASRAQVAAQAIQDAPR